MTSFDDLFNLVCFTGERISPLAEWRYKGHEAGDHAERTARIRKAIGASHLGELPESEYQNAEKRLLALIAELKL
jgi:hypothetical protein